MKKVCDHSKPEHVLQKKKVKRHIVRIERQLKPLRIKVNKDLAVAQKSEGLRTSFKPFDS